MTAPIWLASAPEVHSALLHAGPGAGPLLAAAGAWEHLSSEYLTGADELDALLTAVSALWRGSSADRYLIAHLPYLAWLRQAGAHSAALAQRQQSAVGAYVAALATMPTPGELAANRLAHGVLIATNFFGINTVPIAVTETDYARMWLQAATTMATYHCAAAAALSPAGRTPPAPRIARADDPFGLSELLNQLQRFEGADNAGQLIWPGNPLTAYPPGTDLSGALSDAWTSITQGLFLYDPQTLTFAHNPVQWISALALAAVQMVTHRIFDLMQIVYNFPQLLTAVLPLIAAEVAGTGGLAGLAGLAGLSGPLPAPAAPAPIPAAADGWSMLAGPAAAGQPGPPAAPSATPATPAAPPAPPIPPPAAPAGAVPGFGYLVGGGPSSGFGTAARVAAGAAASARTGEPGADPALVQDRADGRRRRRTRAGAPDRGYRHEFLAADSPSLISDTGAGPLGATGITPAGLVDAGGPARVVLPLLPDGWGR